MNQNPANAEFSIWVAKENLKFSAAHFIAYPGFREPLHGHNYQIGVRVEGHLDERWADWLHGLTFTHETDGTTTLSGPLADQAALHGVLNRIRDLALPIVSVRRVGPAAERAIQ